MRARFLVPIAAVLGLAGCATSPPATVATAPEPIASAPPAGPEASAYGLFLAGEAARDQGHFGVAAAYLTRAARAEGEPDFLRAQAFSAALRSGDVQGAADLAPDGPDAAPPEKRLGLLTRGVEALAEGKGKDAYPLLSTPDIGYPYQTAAQLLAPYAAAVAGDAAGAAKRPDLGGDPVGQFVADLDRAELEETLGRRAEADADFRSLIAAGDQSGLATISYGLVLERRGQWSEALALYQARLAHDQTSTAMAEAVARAKAHRKPDPQGTLGQRAGRALIIPAASLINQKQTGVALDYLRFTLRLDPTDGEAWLLVGDLLDQVDPEAAREAFAHVPAGSDNWVSARGKFAWNLQAAGRQDEALKAARDTAQAAPASRDAQETLADLLRADSQYAEASQVLTRLIEAPGAKPDWRLYYLRATAYDGLSDAEKTEADLQAALKLAPGQPDLLNFQGYFWIERGERLKDALAMVQKAALLEPQSGQIIDSLGWAYYRLGDYANAVTNLEQAITLEPAIPEVNDHLGDAYWRVGRRTEAVFQWRRVLSLSPDAGLKARVEAKIASPAGPDAPGAETTPLAAPKSTP